MTSLCSVKPGRVRCLSIDGEGPEVVKLKRLGVCGGREIEIVQAGDPMILQVLGSRIGLSRQLASRVIVEAISTNGSPLPEGAAP